MLITNRKLYAHEPTTYRVNEYTTVKRHYVGESHVLRSRLCLALPFRYLSTTITFAVLLWLAIVESASAQQTSKPNSLFIFDFISRQTIQTIVQTIKVYGGRADHVFPPNGVIGYISPANEPRLLNQIPGLRIEHQAVDVASVRQAGGSAELAATMWNMTFQKQDSANLGGKPKGTRRMPPNDARLAPDRAILRQQQSEAAEPLAAPAPGFTETSEYLIGSVVVGIITPESNGAIDSNAENWSTTRQNTVVAKIMQALQWWKDNANAPVNVSFVYDIHHSIPTSYEPIRRSSADEDLWISQVMANLGYPGSTSAYFTQVRQYLNDKRSALGTDWAFAIFVVDSLNDSDGMFSNGDFAYTYLNGPFMVMTYDNDGWGVDEMQIVAAHEHGHLWGALDEYASSGCTDTEKSGYLNIANTNCENGSPATEDSIMRNAANQENVAYPNHLVSTPARQMVGWRDSDGDGKERYDPVDTIPVATLTPFSPDPTTDTTPTYNGSAQDIPFPSPTGPDITINRIMSIEWRLDGGSWQTAMPSDGAFDSYFEDFTFTVPMLNGGTHTFNVRATNTVGNVSVLASETLTVQSAPALSINDVSVTEGNSGTINAAFTVGLSASSAQTVTVTFSTANGTATAGSDYIAKSGTVTFNPGETSKPIIVLVAGDTIAEPNETFFVNLTSATNATISDGQGKGTIINDDPSLNQPTADFDGDGASDIGIYREGAWSIIRSSDGGVTNYGWGGPSWEPVVADYDGDGKADIAVYNPIGVWSIVRSSDGGNTVKGWGGPAWIPIPADYDGDGKADIAVYNPIGVWSIVRSSDGGNTVKGWGGPAWIPIPADYDGDGKADIAVYNPIGVWSIVRSSDGGNTVVGWGGGIQDVPVPADYDGDGKADVAIYREGAWSIIRSSDGGVTNYGWGGPSWEPVVADYDGDGKADIAVYNPIGVWSIVRSSDGGNTVVGWGGGAEDVPLN